MNSRLKTGAAGALLALFLAGAQCLGPVSEPPVRERNAVVDGDTLRLQSGDLVRVLGIDAPESRRKVGGQWRDTGDPCAARATLRAHELVDAGPLILEPDGRDRDKYGRLLRHVRLADGRLLGLILIQDGLAVAKNYGHPHRYEGVYEAAQAGARVEERGCVWGK